MWAYEWADGYWVRVIEWKTGCNPLIEVPVGERQYVLRDLWVWLRPVTRKEWDALPSSVVSRRGGVHVLGTVI
jgi:hypothetical protein